MLEVRGLSVSYGPVKVLHGIDLTIGDGEIVALIGPNGAGKTSTLNAIAGLLPHEGEVVLDGTPLPAAAEEVVRRGVALVPQGRRVFPTMTVEENLLMGAYSQGARWKDSAARFAPVYDIFPRLGERRRQEAGKLSGGEQQMLVIGRALLSQPKVVLIDELSLGLAPKMVVTLQIATSASLLQRGRVVYQGSAERLRGDVDVLHSAYLGQSNARKDPALRR
jgi:branched-chain amino acid transport system ATP-binding protein